MTTNLHTREELGEALIIEGDRQGLVVMKSDLCAGYYEIALRGLPFKGERVAILPHGKEDYWFVVWRSGSTQKICPAENIRSVVVFLRKMLII